MENELIEEIEIEAEYTTKAGKDKTKQYKVSSLYNPDMDLISIRIYDGYKGSVYLPDSIVEDIAEALTNINIDKPKKKKTSKKSKTSNNVDSESSDNNNSILEAITQMQESFVSSNKQLQKQINQLKKGKK